MQQHNITAINDIQEKKSDRESAAAVPAADAAASSAGAAAAAACSPPKKPSSALPFRWSVSGSGSSSDTGTSTGTGLGALVRWGLSVTLLLWSDCANAECSRPPPARSSCGECTPDIISPTPWRRHHKMSSQAFTRPKVGHLHRRASREKDATIEKRCCVTYMNQKSLRVYQLLR